MYLKRSNTTLTNTYSSCLRLTSTTFQLRISPLTYPTTPLLIITLAYKEVSSVCITAKHSLALS